MLEIKEEDIIIEAATSQADGSTYYFLDFGNFTEERAEQLKQQILEAVNQYPEAKFALEHEQELFKKLFEESEKNIVIIEELKKCLKNVHFTDEGEIVITQFKKILGVKK